MITRQKRKAFSLMEIMVVIIIMGLLATVVAVNVIGNVDQARRQATRASLKQLRSAVQSFYLDAQRYPTEDEGLEVLVRQPMDVDNWRPGGYLETVEVPTDGWGRPFIYERHPALFPGQPFAIKSLGPDGEESEDDIYDLDVN